MPDATPSQQPKPPNAVRTCCERRALSQKTPGILLANPKMEQIPFRTRSLEVEGARNMPMHKRWAMALKYTPKEFANSNS